MSNNWQEVLDALEVTTTPAAGPGGASGEWHQLVAAFGTRGFLRALTDGIVLALECAPPGRLEDACRALEHAGWTVETRQAPFVARREFPSDVEHARRVWISIARLADAVRGEDGEAFVTAAASAVVAPVATTADATPAAPEPEGEVSSAPAAFEEIGAATPPPIQQAAFRFAMDRAGDAIEVVLGFAEALDAGDYDALEKRLVGNLRGKYDVDVRVLHAHEVSVKLDVEPRTRVALRVVAAPESGLNVRSVEDAVGTYFGTIDDLAGSGIDPLVFLGVRASRRNTGAFESIGAPTTASAAETTSTLLVEDAEPGLEPDGDEVVFVAEAAPLPADAPLEPGRYDDARLKRADATTALVDVVLRHPGYSDRSIGQVLSILLSIDYASCLDLAARAPTVISWGVARDRALTMKTVIEGAGGRVLLVEPGAFGAA